MLNDSIHENNLPINTFDHDSAQLTRQLCGGVAEAFGELYEQGMSPEDLGDAQRACILEVVKSTFLS